MKRICVFLFSGTGMTKYVIDKLKHEFELLGLAVDVYFIETVKMESISPDSYDSIGIAYPVHAFNAPKIVIDFVKKLPEVKSLNTFVICTAGENSPLNFSSSALLIKILSRKGYRVFYDRLFEMPSNFFIKEGEVRVEEKIHKVSEEIPGSVQEIINLHPAKRKSNFLSGFITFLGRLEWLGLAICGNIFHATGKCVSCGLCAANCPNGNIVMGREKALFKRHCGLCMRCLYLCPNHCIEAFFLYKFISFNEWYKNEELRIPGID